MSDILNNYILSFLHPWRTQELLRERRQVKKEMLEVNQLELVSEKNTDLLEEEVGVSFEQSLCVSWLFVIMNGFYVMIGYFMGLETFKSFALEDQILDSFQVIWTSIWILFFLGKLVLFPLYFWLYAKFWVNIIKVFSSLFEKGEDVEEASEQIVSNAFTSHTFMVIPIVGEFLYRITNLIYLFGGLKRNLSFNNLQAGLVILCPLLLFLFAMFMMMLSVGMAASGL